MNFSSFFSSNSGDRTGKLSDFSHYILQGHSKLNGVNCLFELPFVCLSFDQGRIYRGVRYWKLITVTPLFTFFFKASFPQKKKNIKKASPPMPLDIYPPPCIHAPVFGLRELFGLMVHYAWPICAGGKTKIFLFHYLFIIQVTIKEVESFLLFYFTYFLLFNNILITSEHVNYKISIVIR